MEIFKLFGSILVDSAEAEKSISKTGDQAEKTGSKLANGIKTAAKWGAAVVGAATAVGGAMVAAAKDTANTLDAIDKGSQRMKISAEAYQELAYAAELSGVEMSTLEQAAKKLEGTGMSLDSAMDQIMGYATAEERAAAAAELFGDKVAYSMTPMLNAGAEGMAAAKEEAHALGLVMSNDTVAAGASMNDMFTKVEKSVQTLKTGLMADLMPYVAEILQWVVDNIPTIKETVKSVMDAVMPIVKTVLDFVMTALPPVLDAIKALIDWIMPYLQPVLDSVGKLVSGLFALLEGDTETFKENIKEALIGLGTALYDIGADIITMLWDGLKSAWESVQNWFSEKTQWIADKLTFWKSSQNEMSVDGSHAAGLPYVPYDGYIAELHRGETVMTAGQSQNMVRDIVDGIRQAGVGSGAGTKTIVVSLNIDGAEFARANFSYQEDERSLRGGNMIAGGLVAI